MRKRVRNPSQAILRVLTGSSVIKRQPTSVSVVSLSKEHAQKASDLFHQPWFRWCVGPEHNIGTTAANRKRRSYTGEDPIGVELAGALKNVYAIAAGMAEGLGFENNTRASEPCSAAPIY